MDRSEEILQLEREQLKFQKDNISLFRELVEGQSSIKKMMLDIQQHQTKNVLMMVLIVFLCGVLIGTGYKSWLPYVEDIVNVANNGKKITKAIEAR